jgi:hypothetical protein
VLAGLWVVGVLYWPAVGVSAGSVVFLTLALVPVWLMLLASVAIGGARWVWARKRLAGCVCPVHYHRFVPGPRLGWVERWTGRLLLKHRGGSVKDLTADAVCRACGGTGRLEGVKEVVAVLDNAVGRESWVEGGALRVNWLRYRKLLDFERVEILRAEASEVEAFVLQSRFQAEASVRAGLSRMVCVVGPAAELEEKTLLVLRPVFGRVEERGRA